MNKRRTLCWSSVNLKTNVSTTHEVRRMKRWDVAFRNGGASLLVSDSTSGSSEGSEAPGCGSGDTHNEPPGTSEPGSL